MFATWNIAKANGCLSYKNFRTCCALIIISHKTICTHEVFKISWYFIFIFYKLIKASIGLQCLNNSSTSMAIDSIISTISDRLILSFPQYQISFVIPLVTFLPNAWQHCRLLITLFLLFLLLKSFFFMRYNFHESDALYDSWEPNKTKAQFHNQGITLSFNPIFSWPNYKWFAVLFFL